MTSCILHIDFDSFFASVEQQHNPGLRNKPIGVTASHSRTAIIAASKEAKKLGVTGGSSWVNVQQFCPQLILVPAHFVLYFEISKEFIRICRLYSPFIEVFSIDELFMDITSTVRLFGGVEKLIARLKSHIAKELGEYITVSVGVSYNKMLAKLASGLDKPNGLVTITKENIAAIYQRIQLTDICGIGSRINARLNELGIYTLRQLQTAPYSCLEAEFGPYEAHFLKNVAEARDDTPIIHFGNSQETKSVGRNYCLPKNEYDKRIILQTVFELFEEIAIKLRRLKKKARTVGIFLRGEDSLQGRKTTDFFTNSGKEMFEIVKSEGMLDRLQHIAYIRQVSVLASSLIDEQDLTCSLLETVSNQNQLLACIDSINERFGDHVIRNGFLLQAPILKTVPNGFLADKGERTLLTKLY